MINVRQLANAAIQNVNPNNRIVWKRSNGYTSSPSGKRTPTYDEDQYIYAQIQGTSGEDQRHIDGLNLTGVFRKVWVWGNAQSNVRVDLRGGDLFIFPEENYGPDKTWLVINVGETWSNAGWCSVLVQLQS